MGGWVVRVRGWSRVGARTVPSAGWLRTYRAFSSLTWSSSLRETNRESGGDVGEEHVFDGGAPSSARTDSAANARETEENQLYPPAPLVVELRESLWLDDGRVGGELRPPQRAELLAHFAVACRDIGDEDRVGLGGDGAGGLNGLDLEAVEELREL